MARGFLAGIFWGGIVGFAMLAVSSFVFGRQELSLPRPEAVPVEVPAGTEFDQARPETDPVVPEAETRPDAEQVSGVVAPEDAVETPPSFDTSSLEVPQPSVDGPGGLAQTPDVAEEIDITVTGPAGSSADVPAAGPELVAPDVPGTAPETATDAPVEGQAPDADDVAVVAPEVVDEPAPVTPAPDVSESPEKVTPRIIETDSALVPSAPAAPEAVEAPVADEAPNAIIRVDGGESEFFRPVDEIGNMAQNVETDRLPRIGSDPVEVAPVLPSDDASQDATDTTPQETLRLDTGDALTRWATAFEAPDDKPLMSIVLVHEGDAALAQDVVDGLPAAVSFGVNAGSPGAATIARAYRDMGREVVMIPSLPFEATPQDVEVALRVNFETIPEAVAVMDNSGDSFQSNRSAVAQVVDVVTASGHGLITFPRGLNTAHQRAERAGVPTGLIFRDIDGADETNEQIRRAMDRAAFRARQNEAVILVGRTEATTLEALAEWVLGNRAASVTLAPISAALMAD
ncbi:divergent polysaccharide deacetylase family protein [Boseongicola aestuarii]|uniref:Divergent polysaccharide deacetylase n=1 Tax=Boseongicola aestuarii TaxID=1470561 RepID=A0A238IWS0_9RHOB|nr:divergent polysaccharide deacetylase family protein [Boseongicola aestuarii]SMX22124.1 Divergent polysaccharide deacetylase [Boseongicola aestuarii]